MLLEGFLKCPGTRQMFSRGSQRTEAVLLTMVADHSLVIVVVELSVGLIFLALLNVREYVVQQPKMLSKDSLLTGYSFNRTTRDLDGLGSSELFVTRRAWIGGV